MVSILIFFFVNSDLQDEDATAGVLLAALMEQAARADSVLKTGAVSQYITEISLAN